MTARLRVAFQEELGAFGELAIRQLFGAHADAMPQREFRDVADALAVGLVDRAVLPVHNSIIGLVLWSVEALKSTPSFHVIGETYLAVKFCVLGVPGSYLDRARELHTHPVALAQTGRCLAVHPDITPRLVHDTASVARMIAERHDKIILALASAVCAKHVGLVVLAHDAHDAHYAQDIARNVTRFVLVERSSPSAWRSAINGLRTARGTHPTSCDRPRNPSARSPSRGARPTPA